MRRKRRIYAIQVPTGGKITYNVGMIEGGTSVNTIAQKASKGKGMSECRIKFRYKLNLSKRYKIFKTRKDDGWL